MGHALPMKLDHLPRTCPYTFSTIRAPLFDDFNLRLHQFNGIFRTNAHAAAAEIAFAGNDVDHERGGTGHGSLHSV